MLTAYDERGGYGHPDHIQVHDVGVRAAELARHPARLRGDGEPPALPAARTRAHRRAARRRGGARPRRDRARRRRGAHHHHRRRHRACSTASAPRWPRTPCQIAEESFFLALPDDLFAATFGTEWFIRLDSDAGRARDLALR